MYTQCPYCRSVFRVTTSQIKHAQGDVRCGQCAEVFNALEGLLEQIPDEPGPSPDAAVQSAGTQDTDAGPDTEQESRSREGPPGEAPHETDPVPAPAAHTESGNEPAEEPATMQDPQGWYTDPGYESYLDPEILAGDGAILDDYIAPDREAETVTGTDGTLPETGDTEHTLHDEAFMEQAQDREGPATATDWEDVLPVMDDFAHEEFAVADQAAANGEPDSVSELPPLLHETAEARPDWRPVAAWAVMMLALGILLIGQTVYFWRNGLAQDHEELRPWLTALCETLGCEITLRRDPGLITLLDREVSTHPTEKNALMVRATLVNLAGFDQPYPVMQLRLFRQEHTVAQRHFLPGEYLPPKTDISRGMRSQQPVTIELEIVDPGLKSDGYAFDFL